MAMDTRTFTALTNLVRSRGQDPDVVIHQAIRRVEMAIVASNSSFPHEAKYPTMADATLVVKLVPAKGQATEEDVIDAIVSAMLANRGLSH